jgi:transposase-like protein
MPPSRTVAPYSPARTPTGVETGRGSREASASFIRDTNAIEALNRQLRKAIKTKGSFPSEDAVRKLVYLAIQNAVPQWTRTRGWTKTLLAFKIHLGDRLPE